MGAGAVGERDRTAGNSHVHTFTTTSWRALPEERQLQPRRFPMLLTISTTHRPATDLGQLLHHDLDGIGMTALPFGRAVVCCSQADEARCTVAVMLDAGDGAPLGPAQLGQALAQVFDRALQGRDDTRPELASRPLPFEVALPVLPSRGGPALVRRLFEPLGYRVTTDPVPFDAPPPDEHAPGEVAVELAGDVRIADLLSHLCVLLPVLDETPPATAGHHWPRRRQCSRTA